MIKINRLKTTILLSFFSLFFIQFLPAQQYIFGKVATEENRNVSGAQVVNLRNNEIAVTDQKGLFMIAAQKGDLIRIVSNQFSRQEFRVTEKSFVEPVNITVTRPAVEIEEVKIAFSPTGNLPKDVRALETSTRVQMLKNELNNYVMKPMAVAEPSLTMPQTLSMGPNYSAGQVNAIGLLTAVAGLVQKATAPKMSPPTYYETQQFYAEVKRTVDRKHFVENGLDEFQFDQLIAYADRRYSLALKYRKDFDSAVVTSYLKMALNDFLTTQKPKSVKGLPAPAAVLDAA